MKIGVFLYNLRRFADRQQVVVGNKTFDLLHDTVTFIHDEFIPKAKAIEVPNEENTDFIQDLDPTHFEIQQSIMCRLCKVGVHSSCVCKLFQMIFL